MATLDRVIFIPNNELLEALFGSGTNGLSSASVFAGMGISTSRTWFIGAECGKGNASEVAAEDTDIGRFWSNPGKIMDEGAGEGSGEDDAEESTETGFELAVELGVAERARDRQVEERREGKKSPRPLRSLSDCMALYLQEDPL